jgi:hypothetical protein
MKKFWLVLALAGGSACPGFASTYVLTIAGLGGEPDYEQRFQMLATDTDKILRGGTAGDRIVETLKGPDATKAKVEAALSKIAGEAKQADVFILMMIGHGTFDSEYKFNLPGPDLSAAELNAMLNKIPAGRQLVVDMTSASGAITDVLKKDNRTIITATKSGTEKNATVFARFWVEALRDNSADTDKNGQVTALEAYKYALAKTNAYYSEAKHLATEHPQLDAEQRAAAFTLVRYGAAEAVVTDPAKKALLVHKEDVENKIDSLKFQKDLMAPEEYRRQLTALLLDLAKTQAEIEK